MKRIVYVIGAVVFAMVGASVITRLTTSPHSDFTTPAEVGSVAILQTGDGWALEKITGCYGDASFDGFRLRVGNRTTQCFGTEAPLGGGAFGEDRGSGHRLAWFTYAAAQPPTARFYSSDSHGVEVSLHAMPGQVYLGVVDLGTATPYGVQFIAPDGTLLSTDTYLTYRR
jgi:hypothetical protein